MAPNGVVQTIREILSKAGLSRPHSTVHREGSEACNLRKTRFKSRLFKCTHLRPLSLYFSSLLQTFKVLCPVKVADAWIRTWVLWYRKRPRCQLCHCPQCQILPMSFLKVPSPASFSFFSNNLTENKLQTSAGFKLGLSE